MVWYTALHIFLHSAVCVCMALLVYLCLYACMFLLACTFLFKWWYIFKSTDCPYCVCYFSPNFDSSFHLIECFQVWSLSKGKLLRNVVFPSIIDAIALDPGEQVFHAGSRDGKIYVAALNAESTFSNNYGLHIMGAFSNHRFVCLS